jgi:hypothetical protein
MRVPGLCPLQRITVNGGEEEVMQKPNMAWASGIETVVGFEVEEKYFPLLAEAVGNVVPETFYPGVMNAPEN